MNISLAGVALLQTAANAGCDLSVITGFSEERLVRRDALSVALGHFSRRQEYRQTGPVIARPARDGESVDVSGQGEVGEDRVDRAVLLENLQCLYAVGRFHDGKAAVGKAVDDVQTNEHLILNNQDLRHGADVTAAWRPQSSRMANLDVMKE